MNTTNFNQLKILINCLTAGEISTAKKFLVAFDSNVTRNKNKGQKLFKLIVNRPHVKIEKAKKAISADVDERSFDRQIIRLKEKILESLLLDINTTKKEVYSKWEIARMDIRKKLLQGYIIYGRGLYKEGQRVFDKVIEKAKEFELYNELVESLYVKQQELGLRQGKKAYEGFTEEISFYKRCADAVYKAKDWYTRYFIEEVDYNGLNSDRVGLLTEAIADLQEEYKVTKSDNVLYRLYFLMIGYYLALEDYEESYKINLRLIDLIKKSEAICTPRRLGIAYSDLADNDMFLFEFDRAIKNAMIAQSYYINRGYNYQVAKEIEFKSYYYKGDFKNALKTIEQLISLTDKEDAPFQFNKRIYFRAVIYFLLGKYQESYSELQNIKEIEGDKEGWNIGVRLLSIQNLIELSLLDNADNMIEAMRKHIERIRRDKNVRERDEVILKLLIQLEKSSFDFEKVKRENKQEFDLLDIHKDYRWQVKTPEMIVFQDWFNAKLNGKTYQFSLPSSAIKEMEAKKLAAQNIKKLELVTQ